MRRATSSGSARRAGAHVGGGGGAAGASRQGGGGSSARGGGWGGPAELEVDEGGDAVGPEDVDDGERAGEGESLSPGSEVGEAEAGPGDDRRWHELAEDGQGDGDHEQRGDERVGPRRADDAAEHVDARPDGVGS